MEPRTILPHAFARTLALLLACALPGTLQGQSGLRNGDFAAGGKGAPPPGWVLPSICREAGFELEIARAGPDGSKCAVLRRPAAAAAASAQFGNCTQVVDAAPFRGRRVRFRAAVRMRPEGEGKAQLWFRVDRTGGQMGFFDNMGDRPIQADRWRHYEIVGDVADDARSIVLGLLLLGAGTAHFDDATLEVVDPSTPTTGPGGGTDGHRRRAGRSAGPRPGVLRRQGARRAHRRRRDAALPAAAGLPRPDAVDVPAAHRARREGDGGDRRRAGAQPRAGAHAAGSAGGDRTTACRARPRSRAVGRTRRGRGFQRRGAATTSTSACGRSPPRCAATAPT